MRVRRVRKDLIPRHSLDGTSVLFFAGLTPDLSGLFFFVYGFNFGSCSEMSCLVPHKQEHFQTWSRRLHPVCFVVAECDLIFPASIINGVAVSKTFQILYRNEDVIINDIIQFKVHSLADANRVGDSQKHPFLSATNPRHCWNEVVYSCGLFSLWTVLGHLVFWPFVGGRRCGHHGHSVDCWTLVLRRWIRVSRANLCNVYAARVQGNRLSQSILYKKEVEKEKKRRMSFKKILGNLWRFRKFDEIYFDNKIVLRYVWWSLLVHLLQCVQKANRTACCIISQVLV